MAGKIKVKNIKTGKSYELPEKIVDTLISKGVGIVRETKKEIKIPSVLANNK